MAFDRLKLVEDVAPALHLHGYSAADIAALYAIASREKQELRKKLEEKDEPPESHAWNETRCRAGARRMAFDRGFSERAIRKGLARLQYDGLIQVAPRGRNLAPYRWVDANALTVLKRAGKGTDLYLKFRNDKKFRLGPLDWLSYLTPEDVSNFPLLPLDEIRKRPKQLYYDGSFKRDKVFLHHKPLEVQGFTVERGDDDEKGDGVLVPCLWISHRDCPFPEEMDVTRSERKDVPASIADEEDEDGDLDEDYEMDVEEDEPAYA